MTSPNWDARWLAMAKLVAGWSKDRSTKVGAVLVGPRNVLLAVGWNGFPRGLRDDIDERHVRPAKYLWTSHAEENAICNCASEGINTRGATLYVTWPPCARCARAIIQAGIKEVVRAFLTDDSTRWQEEWDVAKEMLAEAGVAYRVLAP